MIPEYQINKNDVITKGCSLTVVPGSVGVVVSLVRFAELLEFIRQPLQMVTPLERSQKRL